MALPSDPYAVAQRRALERHAPQQVLKEMRQEFPARIEVLQSAVSGADKLLSLLNQVGEHQRDMAEIMGQTAGAFLRMSTGDFTIRPLAEERIPTPAEVADTVAGMKFPS